MEKAKRVTPRIQPLSVRDSKTVFAFLMAVAIYLHRQEERSIGEGNCSIHRAILHPEFFGTPLALVRDCVQRGLLEWEKEVVLPWTPHVSRVSGCRMGGANTTPQDLFGPACCTMVVKSLEFTRAKARQSRTASGRSSVRGEQSSLERMSMLEVWPPHVEESRRRVS